MIALKILREDEISLFFEVLKANVIRSRTAMAVIILKASIEPQTYYNHSSAHEQFSNFLQSKLRNTDLFFTLAEEFEWGIILTNSGEEEAKALVERLYQLVQSEEKQSGLNFSLQAMVAEIRNDRVTLGDLLLNKIQLINENPVPWNISMINTYKQPLTEAIKVSILEENAIFREVLELSLQNMAIKNVELDIRTFTDGYEFLQSNWYVSGHSHIVIMNDILPRKNGIEVLHTIRRMPNQKKFTIYMMTTRNSQSDMINAYEAGVDGYLVKPFDLRLFEAELRRTFTRLWN